MELKVNFVFKIMRCMDRLFLAKSETSFNGIHRSPIDSPFLQSGSSESAKKRNLVSKWRCVFTSRYAGIWWISRSKIVRCTNCKDVSPVSSSASFWATFNRFSSPSACPPGCSHLQSLAWCSNNTLPPHLLTIHAEAVKCPVVCFLWKQSGKLRSNDKKRGTNSASCSKCVL